MLMVIYIHGTNTNSTDFNFIRQHIDQASIAIEYDAYNNFEDNLEDMKEVIRKYHNIIFISHGVGGLYSLYLSNIFPEKTIGGITISTPYGGILKNDFIKYFFPFSRQSKLIGPDSWAMKNIDKISVQHLWTNIITTKGKNPWMTVPNDGVITIASMKNKQDSMQNIEIEENHYDIMTSIKTINIIHNKLRALYDKSLG